MCRLAMIEAGVPRMTVLAAAVLAAMLAATPASAQDASRPAGAPFPGATPADAVTTFHEIRPRLDLNDEAAALEAVQVALTEVGDGSSYVWYRHGGRLSGIVKPTQSFHDHLGRVCRHLDVTLSAAGRSVRTGAIACRLADGNWVLDG